MLRAGHNNERPLAAHLYPAALMLGREVAVRSERNVAGDTKLARLYILDSHSQVLKTPFVFPLY